MGNVSSRTRGKIEELSGRAKAAVGRAIGNDKMRVAGTAKRLKGEATQQAAKAKERVQGSVEEVTRRVKMDVGGALDNGRMQAKGTIEALRGGARQRIDK